MGKTGAPVANFDSLELVRIIGAPPPARTMIAGMFGDAAFLDGDKCEMQFAARTFRRTFEYRSRGGICAFQRRER